MRNEKSVVPTFVQTTHSSIYTYVMLARYTKKREHVHTVVVIWYGRQCWTRKLSFFDKLFTKCITSTGTNRRTEHFLGKYCRKKLTEFLEKNWKIFKLENVQEMKISFVVNPHCHHHQHIMLLEVFFCESVYIFRTLWCFLSIRENKTWELSRLFKTSYTLGPPYVFH